jgi:hypothetical protein
VIIYIVAPTGRCFMKFMLIHISLQSTLILTRVCVCVCVCICVKVVIKVSDEGGGIKRSNMNRIWSYLYTTADPAILDRMLGKHLSCPTLSYPFLRFTYLTYPTLSCPVPSDPILSCTTLSCTVLSYSTLLNPSRIFFSLSSPMTI